MSPPRITPRTVSSAIGIGGFGLAWSVLLAISVLFPLWPVSIPDETYDGVVTTQDQRVAVQKQRLADKLARFPFALHPGRREQDDPVAGDPGPLGRLRHGAIIELILEMTVGLQQKGGPDLHRLRMVEARNLGSRKRKQQPKHG